MLFFVSPRQGQVSLGRLLRLLYEAVQQDHSVLAIDIEQNAGDAIVREVCADLVDSLTQRSANWHSNGPAEFNRLDVLSNSLSIVVIGKRFEPVPNRFAACSCAKKIAGSRLPGLFGRSASAPDTSSGSLTLVIGPSVYHIWYRCQDES
jgi:hypothetical protein